MSADTTTAPVPANENQADPLAVALVGLEPTSAITLRAAFEAMFAQADDWIAKAKMIKVTSVEQKRDMKLARESRLALREIRVHAEKTRKRMKEEHLQRGRAIDGMAHVIRAHIEPIEAYLLEQETFAERAEAAVRAELADARSKALTAYGVDPSVYSSLGELDESSWAAIVDNARVAHEAKLEAAKQADAVRVEAERLAAEARAAARAEAAKREAERAERERAAAEENARLRAAAAELEAKATAEREAAEAERRRLADEHAKDRAEAAAEAARAAASALAERLAREAAEAEVAAVRAAEARRLADAEASARAAAEAERAAAERAAAAPDVAKLAALAAAVRSLAIPALVSAAGQALTPQIREMVEGLATWIEESGEALGADGGRP